MDEIVSAILDAKKPTPVIVAIEQDLGDERDPNTHHLFLAFPPEEGDGVDTPCSPNSIRGGCACHCSGLGSEMLTAIVGRTHSVTAAQFDRVIFALCRLDAWRVRSSVGKSRTVLFALPGQSCVPLLLPLIQRAFVHERHVFVYDGCCHAVERGLALRKKCGSSYRQAPAKEEWEEVSAAPKVISATFPLAPIRHNRELPGTLASLNGVQASIVEAWMASVDADRGSETALGDSSELALKNVLQYITGSKSRALPKEVMEAALEALAELRTKFEEDVQGCKLTKDTKVGNLSETILVEKCVFTHKSIFDRGEDAVGYSATEGGLELESGKEVKKLLAGFAFDPTAFKLADKYPEFASAWAELQSGRNQSEEHNDAGTTPATPTALASRVSHKFNAALSRSLLHHHFQLDLPSLPPGRLCPPIPNRANYACWIRELLVASERDLCRFNPEYAADTGLGIEDGGDNVGGRGWRHRGIDIGTGVSAIYPLLLSTELFAETDAFHQNKTDNGGEQWKFLATDIDPLAIQSARANVQANHLEDRIFVMQVEDKTTSAESGGEKTQKGPLHAAMEEAKKLPAFQSQDGTPKIDFVMTNPPFYETATEASEPRAGDKRSRTDMSANEGVYTTNTGIGDDMDDNAGENRSDGGDVGFVAAIMADSQTFLREVTWYTSLVAKRSSLDALLKKLQTLDGVWGNRGQIRTVEFRQGNKCESDERWEKKSSTRVRALKWVQTVT
ncbi:hypothetical protein ACHAXT_005126 [Thalassiosira profunda]